jgi:hypothetical protein
MPIGCDVFHSLRDELNAHFTLKIQILPQASDTIGKHDAT